MSIFVVMDSFTPIGAFLSKDTALKVSKSFNAINPEAYVKELVVLEQSYDLRSYPTFINLGKVTGNVETE